jgi:hypothetical protein
MGLIKNLFGRRVNSFEHPLCIENPVLGFLNLRGSDGRAEMNVDYSALKPLFAYVRMSDDVVPECDVLFIYAALDPTGAVLGSKHSLAKLIRSAGASIAVIASVNPLAIAKVTLA